MNMLIVPLLSAFAAQDAGSLRYVVPEPGEVMRAPRTRALAVSDRVPDDVTVAFERSSEELRIGQHLYGDPGTTRVVFALDESLDGDVRLFVDVNRDRVLAEDELVPPVASTDARRRWETPLDLWLDGAEDETVAVPRRVVFELGETDTVFGIATMGYLEGTLDIDGDTTGVRRRDADANGCFGDNADHLWLDRDGNGDWAPLRELFVTQPILDLASGVEPARFAVRSSRRGHDLRFEKIEGTGTVKLALPNPSGEGLRTDIAEASVVLVGRDGSSVLVDAAPDGVELPVGEYRITSLSLRLNDAERGQVWSYLFSSAFDPVEDDWHPVTKGSTWNFDPIGTLDFQVKVIEPDERKAPGENVIVQPYLYTGDRLLIRNVYRGWNAPAYNHGGGAMVKLVDEDGNALGQSNSGFA